VTRFIQLENPFLSKKSHLEIDPAKEDAEEAPGIAHALRQMLALSFSGLVTTLNADKILGVCSGKASPACSNANHGSNNDQGCDCRKDPEQC